MLGGTVISTQWSAHFHQPPQKVFDFLLDLPRENQWNPDVIEMHEVTPAPRGKGTRFEGKYKGFGAMAIDVTEYDSPSHLAMRCTGKKMDIDIVFEFAGDNETDMTVNIEMNPEGFFRLLEPLMRSKAQKAFAKRPDQMRAGLEKY